MTFENRKMEVRTLSRPYLLDTMMNMSDHLCYYSAYMYKTNLDTSRDNLIGVVMAYFMLATDDISICL